MKWVDGQEVAAGENEAEAYWRPLGVSMTAQGAEKFCTQSNEFVGPVETDQRWPQIGKEWPGAYFPQRDL